MADSSLDPQRPDTHHQTASGTSGPATKPSANKHRARTTGSVVTDIARHGLTKRSAIVIAPIIAGIALIASVSATQASPTPTSQPVALPTSAPLLTVSPFANWIIPTIGPTTELVQTTQTKAIDSAGAITTKVVPSSYAQSGIPSVALAAYKKAAKTYQSLDPQCGVTWPLLAAIGRVESGHGTEGDSVMTKSGVSVPGVFGPALDGHGPFALIQDTDKGLYDADKKFDRAVGPMQFLPQTWNTVASDGNGDGKKDVQNVWDAALGAANYFCRGNTRLGTPQGLAANIYRYNHSDSYVTLVLGIMKEYGAKVRVIPTTATAPTPTKAPAKKPTGSKTTPKPQPSIPAEPTPKPSILGPDPGTGNQFGPGVN